MRRLKVGSVPDKAFCVQASVTFGISCCNNAVSCTFCTEGADFRMLLPYRSCHIQA